MSKYQQLWKYISKQNVDKLVLTFAEIEKIVGIPIDHSFLSYKKELLDYGFSVSKISMKNQTVSFERIYDIELATAKKL